MIGLYLFAAAAGVPLVAWFLLSGGDDAGGGDDSFAGVMLRRLPLTTIAFVAATFGVCGLVLGLAGTGAGTTFVASAVAGAVAGVSNSAVFGYLRRSESTTEIGDRQLTGKIGRVVLPVRAGHRGRIAVTVGGQQIQLSAEPLPDTADSFDVGAPVLVVDVRNGIARVTGLDPELA
jgi:membrane protein implicated in regulation of membrane protease activity